MIKEKNVKSYQVERIVVEYTTVDAESETEALNLACMCGDWNIEPLVEGEEVHIGYKVFEI